MRDELIKKIRAYKGQDIVCLNKMKIKDNEILPILKSIQATNPALTVLNLDGNQLTDTGAKILAEGLSAFPSLSDLSVQFNEIGKEGATTLLRLKTVYPKLDLSLRGNKITNMTEMYEIEQSALKMDSPFKHS